MLDKLKDAAEAAKGFLIWIITPLFFVAGYIYYLITQNENLKSDVAKKELAHTLDVKLTQAKEAENAANDAESNYNRIRDEFIKSSDGGTKLP